MTNADILSHLVQFVLDKQFLFFAPVCRSWKAAWGQRRPLTSYVTAETSLSQVRYSLTSGLPREGIDGCTMSARVGNLEVLQWARSWGCLWDAETCTLAAQGGFLTLLLWARRAGCPWNESVCTAAASRGGLEMLKTAREMGFPWTAGMCAAAAKGGHLELLQWCRAGRCTWDDGTPHDAAWSGDLATRQRAHRQRVGVTFTCWSGCAARGMQARAAGPPHEETLLFCSGAGATAVPGTRTLVFSRQWGGTSSCSCGAA